MLHVGVLCSLLLFTEDFEGGADSMNAETFGENWVSWDEESCLLFVCLFWELFFVCLFCLFVCFVCFCLFALGFLLKVEFMWILCGFFTNLWILNVWALDLFGALL